MDFKQIVIDGNRRMVQGEVECLYNTALSLNPLHILEIGSADGTSSITLGLVAKEVGGKLQCIEPRPTGKWKGNMERYQLNNHVQLINKPSPWIPAAELNLPVDYLFIDGNHKLKWTITDYQWGQYYVREGGLIAFHDAFNPGEDVRTAIEHILKTDRLKEVARVESKLGLIVFEKEFEYGT